MKEEKLQGVCWRVKKEVDYLNQDLGQNRGGREGALLDVEMTNFNYYKASIVHLPGYYHYVNKF